MVRSSKWMAVVACVVLAVVGCAATPDVEPTGSSVDGLSPSCDAVKCPMPLCAQGQHLTYQGGCCPTCVGPDPKCEAVLCPMLMCAIGEQLVAPKGQCCPRCVKATAAPECTTDADCPVLTCIACPCPVTSCVGRTCRTSTHDASTCGTN